MFLDCRQNVLGDSQGNPTSRRTCLKSMQPMYQPRPSFMQRFPTATSHVVLVLMPKFWICYLFLSFFPFLSSQNMLTIFGQKRYIYLPKHICSAYLGPKIDLLLSPNRAVYAFAPKIYLPLSPGRQPCRVSNTIPATLGRYLKPV